MAIRRTNILGPISGKLGNSVTRTRYGKQVTYLLPDKVKISSSEAAKAARRKFGLTVKFAKFINSITVLSKVWSAAKIPGVNSYQRLIKHNSKRTGENNLARINIITPQGTLPAPLNCSYKDDIITLEIGSGLYNCIPFIIHTVFNFYEPAENKLRDFSFEYIQMKITELEVNNGSSVLLPLNSVQKDLFAGYNKCIIYTAVSKADGKIKWSSTSSFTLK